MLEAMIKSAKKEGLRVAPFIGIGCPGRIEEDGSIDAARRTCRELGKQPLQSADSLREAIPEIGEDDTVIVMHNDAVVQGLSEVPS